MILITGGTGFVGRHLQRKLAERRIECFAFPKSHADLTDPVQANAVFQEHREADTIVHLASYQAAGVFPARFPADQFQINNRIHLNVLDAWRRFMPDARLIAIGTSCAYPSSAVKLTEDVFLDGDVHGSVYAYAFTKRLLWMGIKALNDQYKMNGSYLIPATMFGEYDDFHEATAHVTGALIGKFVRAVREGLPEVEVWGDGTQVREFIDVEDFVTALLHVAPVCHRDIINVGPGRGTSIRDLAEAIGRAAGFRGKIVFNAERYMGIREKFMDATKLARDYEWKIPTDLDAGLARTCRWVDANYEALKDKPKFPGVV